MLEEARVKWINGAWSRSAPWGGTLVTEKEEELAASLWGNNFKATSGCFEESVLFTCRL